MPSSLSLHKAVKTCNPCFDLKDNLQPTPAVIDFHKFLSAVGGLACFSAPHYFWYLLLTDFQRKQTDFLLFSKTVGTLKLRCAPSSSVENLEQRLLDRHRVEQAISSSLVAMAVGQTSVATLKNRDELINTSLQHCNRIKLFTESSIAPLFSQKNLPF